MTRAFIVVIACVISWCVYAVSQDLWSHWHLHVVCFIICMWLLLDGVLLAMDLQAAEQRARDINIQLVFYNNKFTSLNTVAADTAKRLDENHTLMLEIRTRLLHISRRQKESKKLFSSSCPNVFPKPELFRRSLRKSNSWSSGSSVVGDEIYSEQNYNE